MGYYQKYQLRFENFEEQALRILIEDTYSAETNPYGLSHTIVDNGGGTQTINVSFTSIPAGCTGTQIFALDGNGVAQGNSGILSNTSPVSWGTCPSGAPDWVYLFYFKIPVPGDDELFVLGELDGITDELTPGPSPLKFIGNNNQENKLEPIQTLQAVMQFYSDSNNNLNKLLRMTPYTDRRYKVSIYINERICFIGWMLAADSGEPFMPHPNVITLTAVCGLSSLKSKTLLKPDGSNPTGMNKLIEYISWCLQLTGFQLQINAVLNLREEDAGTLEGTPGDHFLVHEYIDAKTFEKEIGECEDAYTVLSKILRYLGVIGQRYGTWFIKAFDEWDMHGDYMAQFNYDGEFQDLRDPAFYEKEIGIDENMKFINASAFVTAQSPAKFTRLTYRWENPKELPCNVDFSRGETLFNDISADEKEYVLDCWGKYWENTTTDDPATDDIVVVKKFINGYESERYVKFPANATQQHMIKSERMKLNVKDKFNLDVALKFDSDAGGTGEVEDNHIQVRLFGNDGTFWTFQSKKSSSNESQWVQCTSTFRTNQKYFTCHYMLEDDQTQEHSIYDGEAKPLPVSGEIEIVIKFSSLYGATKQTRITRCSFEYLPYNNGTYNKYSGQYHQVTGREDNEKIDEEVYISDAPNSIIKGGLHKDDSGDKVLCERFYNGAVFPAGVPDATYLHPFGYVQAFAVWNQVRLMQRIMRGTIQGLETDSADVLDRCDLPTVFHTYYLRDVDEATNGKHFRLLNFEMDMNLCEWTGVFKEAYDENRPKVYSDDYVFKYISA